MSGDLGPPPPPPPPPPASAAAPWWRRPWAWAAGAGIVLVAVAVALLTGEGEPRGGSARSFGDAVADPVPYDGRSPVLPAGRVERVLVELPRPALGAEPGLDGESPAGQREYVASLKQESTSLISALRARGVKLGGVVTFERTWHGFAATLPAKQLTRLQSLGVRLRTNRRLFPAHSQPVRVGNGTVPAPPEGAPRVTLLGGGRLLEGALAQFGVRARALRVTAVRSGEEFGRTDELLRGLERTVDPDGDGDTRDHDRVALIGVSAPFAGFADAPETAAVTAAAKLGTLMVASAGDEGPAAGAYGTIGAPGASPGALAVVAQSDQGALARTRLTVGNTTVRGAALLGCCPFEGILRTGGPVSGTTPGALLAKGQPGVQGRLAIVRAGANPGAQAAAAARSGARAVLLAEPRDGHVLPTVATGQVPPSAGGEPVPVLGVTGPAAAAILALPDDLPARSTGVQPPAPQSSAPLGTGPVSRFASQGPAYDGAPKPELDRPGSIVVGGQLFSGSAVAAARAAADAAQQGGSTAAVRDNLLAPGAAARDTAAREAGPLQPPPVPVSDLDVRLAGGTAAVTFSAGSFDRGDPAGGRGAVIVPAARLDLTLETSTGRGRVRRLTPPGGARDVLPGQYAYTLPRAVFRRLTPGSYAFNLRARSPGQAEPTLATSPVFAKK